MTACRSVWALRPKLRLPDLVASAITCWATLLAFVPTFLTCQILFEALEMARKEDTPTAITYQSLPGHVLR